MISELTERLRKFRDERDWGQFHTPKDLAISVSVEASELLEIFQWNPADQVLDKHERRAAEDEIADVFIYLLMLADRLGVDVVAAAHRKVEANELRFPLAKSRGIAKPSKE